MSEAKHHITIRQSINALLLGRTSQGLYKSQSCMHSVPIQRYEVGLYTTG